MNIKSVLLTAAMAAVSANSFADASQPERHVQEFLKSRRRVLKICSRQESWMWE